MRFQIAGLGTAVPEQFVTQEDAARFAVEYLGAVAVRTSTIPALYRRAGVRTRHSVVLLSSTNGEPATQSFFPMAVSRDDRGPTTGERMRRYEADALDLSASAGQSALENAALPASAISHLVTVSCSGFSAPGVDIGLIERLGLPDGVSRTNIGFMGCHGALNALRVAAALATADPEARVLICCTELCTLHQQYTSHAEQIVANALFGDGAAAVVGSAPRSSESAWQVVQQRSVVLPGTAHLMSWRIGDHGFEMSLSPQVPDVIRAELRPWLAGWLAEHHLSIGDVASWAVHPGGPRILTATADALEIDRGCLAPSEQVLADYGNMSSPTILFLLDRFRRESAPLPCIALAFGPGLTIEAALIR